MRSREWRRIQTWKKIKKRLRTINRCWQYESEYEKEPHRLHKWNLACGCIGCRENRKSSYRPVGDKSKGKNKRKWYHLIRGYNMGT